MVDCLKLCVLPGVGGLCCSCLDSVFGAELFAFGIYFHIEFENSWLVISTMAVAVTVTGDYYLVGSLVLPLYLSG